MKKMKERRNVKKILITTALITAGLVTIGGNTSKAALEKWKPQVKQWD